MLREALLTYRRVVAVFCHLGLAGAAYGAAFFLRFDGSIPPDYQRVLLTTLPLAVGVKGLALCYFKLTRGLWRYVSMDDLVRICKAAVLGSALLVVGTFLFWGHAVPRSVFIIDFLLTVALFGGVRFCVRLFRETFRPMIHSATDKRMLIVGAGDAGEMALRAVRRDFQEAYTPVGFVDDNRANQGRSIHGLPILGAVSEARRLVAERGITDVLIAMPEASKRLVREIVEMCSACNVSFHIMPTFRDIITGELATARIRDVRVEDLLGRDPVQLDKTAVSDDLKGRCVLVTGAGGSIGSELARQIASCNPGRLVLLDVAETPLFEIENELRASRPGVRCDAFLGDVKHPDSVEVVFERFRPERVFHAAAYKHVPLMESHPVEAVLNNVFGTRNLAEAATRHGVERFVMISTDKAVRPAGAMGASKRIAELVVSHLGGNGTKFMTVRFGNVLGSSGSVVKIFRRQIAQGGAVTVTHPEVARFFMTIPEAVELILQAGTIGKGSEVFVLDMGDPVKIVDLARNMIELSGLHVGTDIEIEFVGLRPGEKLYEELVAYGEHVRPTSIPKVMLHEGDGNGRMGSGGFARELEGLERVALQRDETATVETLWRIMRQCDPDVERVRAGVRGAAQ